MYHHSFAQNLSGKYPVVLLLKPNSFTKTAIKKYYVDPLVKMGIPEQDILALSLECEGKKPKASEVNSYVELLRKALDTLGAKQLLITDSSYFKKICSESKSDVHLGYMKETIFDGIQGTLGINYLQIMFDSIHEERSMRSLSTLADSYKGSYVEVGSDIIKSGIYPKTLQDIQSNLAALHLYTSLTIDIEAFSLNIHRAGIATIAFGISQTSGIAFACDYKAVPIPLSGTYGTNEPNEAVRALIREFLGTYKGKLIAHNANYDIKVLIYNLFMDCPEDIIGMKNAIAHFSGRLEDTRLIAYVCLNSTEDYKVGLKALAHEFAGNYGQDNINDVTLIPLQELLEYNLKDCLCTWYVYDKYVPIMIAEQQEDVYRNFFLPSLMVVIEMETWGLPVKSSKVDQVQAELLNELDKQIQIITSSPDFQLAENLLIERHMDTRNAALVKKQLSFMDAAKEFGEFNLNSTNQLRVLLYDVMEYPVVDYTKTKQPATGKKTLEKLKNLEIDVDKQELLDALLIYSAIEKIMSSFIPAFKAAYAKSDGRSYINGSFNLGGTISGRLSSSDPNLQNLPSGSVYGKPIKSQVSAPDGWIFVSADYNALEDKVNTILTNDPNKVKIFTQGYDGHCYRAFYYWGDEMKGIVDTVTSINSIKDLFPKKRNKSKAPSFALQYAGTWITLVKNCGFPDAEAKKIEANYRKMYQVSIDYTNAKLDQVAKDGYATLAFGLKLRCPLLTKTKLGMRQTPYQAEADARSVGNAIGGQSYCMLNNKSSFMFMDRVNASEYRNDIIPVSWIHDAQYYMVRNDISLMKWMNDNLIECMEWQDLPELQHPDIKLGAEMDIHFPSWDHALTVPNGVDEDQLIQLVKDYLLKLKENKVVIT